MPLEKTVKLSSLPRLWQERKKNLSLSLWVKTRERPSAMGIYRINIPDLKTQSQKDPIHIKFYLLAHIHWKHRSCGHSPSHVPCALIFSPFHHSSDIGSIRVVFELNWKCLYQQVPFELQKSLLYLFLNSIVGELRILHKAGLTGRKTPCLRHVPIPTAKGDVQPQALITG